MAMASVTPRGSSSGSDTFWTSASTPSWISSPTTGGGGGLLLSTELDRDGELVSGTVALRPDAGTILEIAAPRNLEAVASDHPAGR